MSESKTFTLGSELTVDMLGDHLITWFKTQKGMIAEGGPAQGGYFIQAKDDADNWRKVAGLTKAIQLQLLKAEQNVVVNCGFGKWSDKVGAGTLGVLLFAPLAATATFGAFSQSKLPNEIFNEIEKYILSGGKSVIATIGTQLSEDEICCPKCNAKNTKGQKFCSECGEKLTKECPKCQSQIENGMKFCPNCGTSCNES